MLSDSPGRKTNQSSCTVTTYRVVVAINLKKLSERGIQIPKRNGKVTSDSRSSSRIAPVSFPNKTEFRPGDFPLLTHPLETNIRSIAHPDRKFSRMSTIDSFASVAALRVCGNPPSSFQLQAPRNPPHKAPRNPVQRNYAVIIIARDKLP